MTQTDTDKFIAFVEANMNLIQLLTGQKIGVETMITFLKQQNELFKEKYLIPN